MIMGLDDGRAGSRTAPAASNGSSPIGAANLAKGRKVYEEICSSCHGPDGNLVTGHLEHPREPTGPGPPSSATSKTASPLPKPYPDLLNEQSLIDVTSYMRIWPIGVLPSCCRRLELCAIT